MPEMTEKEKVHAELDVLRRKLEELNGGGTDDDKVEKMDDLPMSVNPFSPPRIITGLDRMERTRSEWNAKHTRL